MLNAITNISAYVDDVPLEQFRRDPMRRDAVLYNLQIIGEAIKQVPDHIREQHPQIEWRKIAGLRDIIAHDYFGIDLDIIWDVVQNKLPELRPEIQTLLESNI